MSELKKHIKNWLEELNEKDASNFLDNCEVENMYLNTAFDMHSDKETFIYEVTISVPLKFKKNLGKYDSETTAIESALNESAEADGNFIKDIFWRPYIKSSAQQHLDEKGEKITKILNQDYVNKQIQIMKDSIESNPGLALGTSKELIETCCIHILEQNNVQFDRKWDLLKLVKQTNKSLNLMPFEIQNVELAKSSISKILSGFSQLVHGIAELRNNYGTGHGRSPNFKNIDSIYINLAISASSELAIFYLNLNRFLKEKATADKL